MSGHSGVHSKYQMTSNAWGLSGGASGSIVAEKCAEVPVIALGWAKVTTGGGTGFVSNDGFGPGETISLPSKALTKSIAARRTKYLVPGVRPPISRGAMFWR